MFCLKRLKLYLITIALLCVTSSYAFALGGDANQDGSITSADITCVILGIFGLSCAMPDCNGDGVVTSADITCVILAIFGQSPTPTPTPTPELPPSVCPSPPLDTDFTDQIIVTFIDSVNEVFIAITSDGNVVEIALLDIPDLGTRIFLEANVISSTVCNITQVEINFGMVTAASGDCRLEDNFNVFVIENFVIDGIPLPSLRGECDETSFSETRSENPDNTLKKTMLDKLQKMDGN